MAVILDSRLIQSVGQLDFFHDAIMAWKAKKDTKIPIRFCTTVERKNGVAKELVIIPNKPFSSNSTMRISWVCIYLF